MTTPAPTAQRVADVNWPSFAGQIICVVVVDGDDAGTVTMGALTSLRYSTANGVYYVGVGYSEQRLMSNDVVTVVKMTAGASLLSLGLGAKVAGT